MIEELRRDAAHYAGWGPWFCHLGFWAGATYRFGSWCQSLKVAPVRMVLLLAYKILAIPWQFCRCVMIPSRTRIGPGLCLHHPWNILIPPTSEIGRDCTIYHDVTLGLGPVPGTPRIGDNVRIFPGAKVLGGITIGDGAQIGANAVVTRDVPAGAICAPPPVRIILAEMASFRQGGPAPGPDPAQAGGAMVGS